MRWRDLWKLSLHNLFLAPVRSMLTVLGFAIGIAAVLAVLTLGDAGKKQVQSELDRLGIDKLWVTSETLNLRAGDAALVAQRLSSAAAETLYWPSEICYGEKGEAITAIGCTQDFLRLSGACLLRGQMLHTLEWEADSRKILLGKKLSAGLGVLPGDWVHLCGIPFQVCGIVSSTEVFSRMDIDASAFVPLPVLTELAGNTVHEVLVDVPPDQTPEEAAQEVAALFGQEERSVEILTLQAQMDAAQSVVSTFVDVLKWVAFICVLVGGVGVMNMQLVSVRERRREIGVMKSIGAMQGQICALFLTEAVLYAVIGGFLGILLGGLLICTAGASIGLTAEIRLFDVAAVLGAAAVIGLFFGVAPAFRAASMHCVDALREE